MHHFRCITTHTVYETAGDLEKSCIFDKSVEITLSDPCVNISQLIVLYSKLGGLKRFRTPNVTFKVTQGQ